MFWPHKCTMDESKNESRHTRAKCEPKIYSFPETQSSPKKNGGRQKCLEISLLVNFIKLQQVWLIATCDLQTCHTLLKQFAICTSCRKPCKHILISACCNKLLQNVKRLVTTCTFLVVYCSWITILLFP